MRKAYLSIWHFGLSADAPINCAFHCEEDRLRRLLFATMAAVLIGGPATAEENGSQSTVMPPAPTAPTAPIDGPAAEKHEAPVSAGEIKAAVEKETSEQGAGLSQADYKRLLAAEVRRHVPKHTNIRAGSAEVLFTVGASGRVVDYKLKSTKNRKEVEPFARRIMAAIQTPPPPGGSFDAAQSFNFGKSKQEILRHPNPRYDYLRLLWNALEKRRAKALTPHGVIAILHVDAAGRVDAVKIARSSTPEQAEIARKLLHGLKAPPPPRGACYIRGVFR